MFTFTQRLSVSLWHSLHLSDRWSPTRFSRARSQRKTAILCRGTNLRSIKIHAPPTNQRINQPTSQLFLLLPLHNEARNWTGFKLEWIYRWWWGRCWSWWWWWMDQQRRWTSGGSDWVENISQFGCRLKGNYPIARLKSVCVSPPASGNGNKS